MKEYVRMILVLTITCLVSGTLLAWVNKVTERRIWAVENTVVVAAIKSVLPECNNDPVHDFCEIDSAGVKWLFFVGRMNGDYTGCAFMSSARGYGGDVSVMVGIKPGGRINSISIVSHKETPGLGAKITDNKFRNQFKDIDVNNVDLRVKDDGGVIHAVTAATISSRAVAAAVSKGANVYLKHENVIREHKSL